MNAAYQTKITAVFCRLHKLDIKLKEMHQDGRLQQLPFHQRSSLFKNYNRYVKKLLRIEHPVAKAIGIFAVSMLLYSTTAEAQVACKVFKDAVENNPLKRVPLQHTSTGAAFVDIDADGDLDCYSIYRVPDQQYGSYDSVHFSFIKNTGSNSLPFFESAGNGGFPVSPDACWLGFWAQEGPVFADIDGDGDYDCFLANYTSRGDYRLTVEYFENTGDKHNPVFVQRPRDQHPLSFVRGYRGLLFNLVDMDADGDLDLFTFESYYDKFYLNKGTKNNPDFVFIRDDRQPGFGNKYFNHYIFLDWNKDGLLDEIPSGGGVFYTYVGAGEGHHFMARNTVDAPKFTGRVKAQAMVDLNNDGFLEVFNSALDYAVTNPVATIKATENRLDAYPKHPLLQYQWLKDRKIIPNANKSFIEVAEPGEYIVEIISDCGTGISWPYNATINNPVSALPAKQGMAASVNKNKPLELQLYPNPFTEECVLQLDQQIKGKIVVQVTNAQGSIVALIKANTNTVRFGKNLAPGVYFIQVFSGNDVVLRQKLIKQ